MNDIIGTKIFESYKHLNKWKKVEHTAQENIYTFTMESHTAIYITCTLLYTTKWYPTIIINICEDELHLSFRKKKIPKLKTLKKNIERLLRRLDCLYYKDEQCKRCSCLHLPIIEIGDCSKLFVKCHNCNYSEELTY